MIVLAAIAGLVVSCLEEKGPSFCPWVVGLMAAAITAMGGFILKLYRDGRS